MSPSNTRLEHVTVDGRRCFYSTLWRLATLETKWRSLSKPGPGDARLTERMADGTEPGDQGMDGEQYPTPVLSLSISMLPLLSSLAGEERCRARYRCSGPP